MEDRNDVELDLRILSRRAHEYKIGELAIACMQLALRAQKIHDAKSEASFTPYPDRCEDEVIISYYSLYTQCKYNVYMKTHKRKNLHVYTENTRNKLIWRKAEDMQFLNPKFTLREHYFALKNNEPL